MRPVRALGRQDRQHGMGVVRPSPSARPPPPRRCSLSGAAATEAGHTPHASLMQTANAVSLVCTGHITLCKQEVIHSTGSRSFPFRTSDPRHVQDTTLSRIPPIFKTRNMPQGGPVIVPNTVAFSEPRGIRRPPSHHRGGRRPSPPGGHDPIVLEDRLRPRPPATISPS